MTGPHDVLWRRVLQDSHSGLVCVGMEGALLRGLQSLFFGLSRCVLLASQAPQLVAQVEVLRVLGRRCAHSPLGLLNVWMEGPVVLLKFLQSGLLLDSAPDSHDVLLFLSDLLVVALENGTVVFEHLFALFVDLRRALPSDLPQLNPVDLMNSLVVSHVGCCMAAHLRLFLSD